MALAIFVLTPIIAAGAPPWPPGVSSDTLLVRAYSPTDARLAIAEDARYSHPAFLSEELYRVVEAYFGDAFRDAGPRGVVARFQRA
jgi:hypothetical protein